jgi:hypothetical protein
MSRPKPTILLEYVNPKTYKSEQILKADAVYAVYYDGHPVGVRSLNSLINYPGPKYKKSTFINPGHAFNLAEKLNKIFKTDKTDKRFYVVKLTGGQPVTEQDVE